jgi:ankyrin repeat protein
MIPFFIVSLLLLTTSQLIFSAAEKPSYPLHDAIKKQNTDEVNSLLSKRADPSLKDSSGQKAVEIALQYGNSAILQSLLTAGSALSDSKKIATDSNTGLACITAAHLTSLEKKAATDSLEFKKNIGNPLFGASYGNVSKVLTEFWQGGDFGNDAQIVAKRPQGYRCSPEGFKAAAKSDNSDLHLRKELLHIEKQKHLREEFLQQNSAAVTAATKNPLELAIITGNIKAIKELGKNLSVEERSSAVAFAVKQENLSLSILKAALSIGGDPNFREKRRIENPNSRQLDIGQEIIMDCSPLQTLCSTTPRPETASLIRALFNAGAYLCPPIPIVEFTPSPENKQIIIDYKIEMKPVCSMDKGPEINTLFKKLVEEDTTADTKRRKVNFKKEVALFPQYSFPQSSKNSNQLLSDLWNLYHKPTHLCKMGKEFGFMAMGRRQSYLDGLTLTHSPKEDKEQKLKEQLWLNSAININAAMSSMNSEVTVEVKESSKKE